MTYPKRVTTRRRGAELERAILDAAVAELTENGYAGLTMDAVARRAGTNKNAVYRRWPHRAALGVAAYRRLAVARLEAPDTGTLRGDVLALLRRVNQDVGSPRGEILRDLLAGVGQADLLAELRQDLDGGGVWLALLERAAARGEVRPAALTARVATVAITLLRNEYVTRGLAPVADDVLVEIVDEVYLPLVLGRDRR